MARPTYEIDVSVIDRGAERDKRAVSVTIQAKQDYFQLSDMLAKEGTDRYPVN